jgi:hypothetical protein
MAEKQITNPGQAYALGATWGTPSVDNAMTTSTCDLINNTGVTLFTGDIVCLDPTGTMANLPTTATLSLGIGTVGSTLEMSQYPATESIAGTSAASPGLVTNTFPTIVGSTGGVGISFGASDGNIQPDPDTAWQSLAIGFTNGNGNMTSASTATVNPLAVGLTVITPYNASTNATPQIFQITSNGGTSGSWTAVGTSISGSTTLTFTGTTGTFTCEVGRDNVSMGPGWGVPLNGQWSSTSAFAPGQVVPIVTQGLGRVNINALTTQVAGSFLLPTNASVVGTLVLITALTAAQIGLVIATALEPYAQRDTSILTAYGISGHNSVRAIIGRM